MIRWGFRHFAWSCLSLWSAQLNEAAWLHYNTSQTSLARPASPVNTTQQDDWDKRFQEQRFVCYKYIALSPHDEGQAVRLYVLIDWDLSDKISMKVSVSRWIRTLEVSPRQFSCFHFVTFIQLFWKIWTSASGNGNDNLPVSFYMLVLLRDIITYFKLFNWG